MGGSNTTDRFADPAGPATAGATPASAAREPTTERTERPPHKGRISHVRLRNRATLLLVEGPGAGRLHALGPERPVVIGRGADVDVPVPEPSVSRRHARLSPMGVHYLIEDLGSTNGTYVEGEPVTEPRELAPGSRVQLGEQVALRFDLHDTREQQTLEELYRSAIRDPLTRLYNRGYLEDRLVAECSYAHRHHSRLAVLLADLDHFKQVNDVHGHLAGDAALRVVSTLVQRMVRPEDVVARYGGEELAVVARGADERNAMILGQRIRDAVGHLRLRWQGDPLALSISVGVAAYTGERPMTGDALLSAADEALYEAKATGRDRCVLVAV